MIVLRSILYLSTEFALISALLEQIQIEYTFFIFPYLSLSSGWFVNSRPSWDERIRAQWNHPRVGMSYPGWSSFWNSKLMKILIGSSPGKNIAVKISKITCSPSAVKLSCESSSAFKHFDASSEPDSATITPSFVKHFSISSNSIFRHSSTVSFRMRASNGVSTINLLICRSRVTSFSLNNTKICPSEFKRFSIGFSPSLSFYHISRTMWIGHLWKLFF